MGIYDRDYYREQQPGVSIRMPRTAVVSLILINVALYIACAFSEPRYRVVNPQTGERVLVSYWLTDQLAVSNETFNRPWLWWQFLTYGFAHAPSPAHVIMNMLTLWFLGRAVEQRYGRNEFLRAYLVMLILGSVIWALTTRAFDPGPRSLVGASGAVCGVVILFVLNYPRQTLILFPIPIPIKAWVIGVLLVVVNLAGAVELSREAGTTAYGVHLTGMAFALLYFHYRWNLGWMGRLGGRLLAAKWLRRRPKLRIHNPQQEDAQLSREVDRILEKISLQGEESLSRKERRTLESASREYQRRRRG